MITQISGLLNPAQLETMQRGLLEAEWVDGRASAGFQGARVKHNRQLAENDPLARELGDIVLHALERNPLFISAALPNKVYPPMFNRYDSGMRFGDHIDNALRLLPVSGAKVRTDLAATLFLSDPASYEGGELLISDTYGPHAIKLPAGDLLLYPASSVHRVNPVSRGVRLASFFWVQSLVRSDERRSVLFELDRSVQRLNATHADETARLQLTGCYHNLLRMWSEP